MSWRRRARMWRPWRATSPCETSRRSSPSWRPRTTSWRRTAEVWRHTAGTWSVLVGRPHARSRSSWRRRTPPTPPLGGGGSAPPLAARAVLAAAEAAAEEALSLGFDAEAACCKAAQAAAAAEEASDSQDLNLANFALSRLSARLATSAQTAEKLAAAAAKSAGRDAEVCRHVAAVAAGLAAARLETGERAMEVGCQKVLELAKASSPDASAAAAAAGQVAGEISRAAGKPLERIIEDAAEAARQAAASLGCDLDATTQLGLGAAGAAAAQAVALSGGLNDSHVAREASSAVAKIAEEALELKTELLEELTRATGKVVECALARARVAAVAAPAPAPEAAKPPEAEDDTRVQELLKAREKSFAALAEMQERCRNQQAEMEKLLKDRTERQEEVQQLRKKLRGAEQELQEAQAQVEQQREEMETMSHTTGDDSVAESQGLTPRRNRKKRNARGGLAFKQARCLDEGVELEEELPRPVSDPNELLIRGLISRSHASSLWHELIIFLLQKAGEDGLPQVTAEGDLKKELQAMAQQLNERLDALSGHHGKDEGMLTKMLKHVGKVTDQVVDTAVLYVDQNVANVSPRPSAAGSDLKESSTPRSPTSPASASLPEGEPTSSATLNFKQTARLRLQARRNRQRTSILSVATTTNEADG
ncbi:unnamed protein product [Effrenium voratum]|uniref:Uncharacterized protein n=1 Tax=Effrenium voratum TaxID=2562239 RepID=A0AA36MWL2_9DINO|nr:unnamed protein product [Effrenium voratum]